MNQVNLLPMLAGYPEERGSLPGPIDRTIDRTIGTLADATLASAGVDAG